MPLDRTREATELGKTLDALDALEDERAAVLADLRARKKALERRCKELRDILSGRAGVQEDLPLSGPADG